MSDQQNKKHGSKRRTLKTLLGGTGAVAGSQMLPEQWMKPIISTVIMPAHGLTSPGPSKECSINEYVARGDGTGSNEVIVDIEFTADVDAGQEWFVEFSSPGTVTNTSGETEGTINPAEFIAQEYDVSLAELMPSTELEVTIDIGGIRCDAETTVTPD